MIARGRGGTGGTPGDNVLAVVVMVVLLFCLGRFAGPVGAIGNSNPPTARTPAEARVAAAVLG